MISREFVKNIRKVCVCQRRYQSSFVRFDSIESNLKKHEIVSNEKRELILTILNSTATKREARSYLSKYRLLHENDIYKNNQKIVNEGYNLESPLITNEKYSNYINKVLTSEQENNERSTFREATNRLNRHIHDTSSEIQLTQTIRTCLIRVRRLDTWDNELIMHLGVVLRKSLSLGASPVILIDRDITKGCESMEIKDQEAYVECKLENLLDILASQINTRIVRGCFDIAEDLSITTVVPEMIVIPIVSGIVPIISPFGVTRREVRKQCMDGFQMTKATIKCLEENEMHHLLSVEKVVFIDEIGGFPSVERSGSHVLINMRQEYEAIKNEILYKLRITEEARDRYLSNLEEMKDLLKTSDERTGILTTPNMATREQEKQVGKETNPIIFNILTDRPTISSSLPVSLLRTPQVNTTIVKNGMDIRVHLEPDANKGLDLVELHQKGKIDLKKLKFLIDDSFGRNLNLHHYLNRINKKVAGLIILGDYEGGAIITWENSGSRNIAYLDKLAVVKQLQGIPGVADIIFKALLNSFKAELLWRSRNNNPVNKWYFERSKANYSIPGTQWRMFVNGTKELTLDDLKEYIQICGSIEPSFDIPDEKVTRKFDFNFNYEGGGGCIIRMR